MNRGRVGEERRGKEMDGCPLTWSIFCSIRRTRNCQIQKVEDI
jgi:hypothetical protein